jgi:hypothetical protein
LTDLLRDQPDRAAAHHLDHVAVDVPPAQPPPDPRDAGADPYAGTGITVGDLVRHVIARNVALEEHEYDAVALWAIHTHLYQQFMFTPRLLLSSPAKGCGKTTLLDVLSSLVARGHRSDSVTAAVLYHHVCDPGVRRRPHPPAGRADRPR